MQLQSFNTWFIISSHESYLCNFFSNFIKGWFNSNSGWQIAPSAKFQKSRPVICGFSYRIKRLFWISYLAFWLTCFCTLFFLFTIYAIKFNGHRHRVSPFRIQFSRLHGCRPSILRFIRHVVALGQILRKGGEIPKTYSKDY